MTITNLTIGTATTGNNAAVTPGTPSGLVAGDLMLIFAAIRNSGTGTPATPSGWVRMSDATTGVNAALFGRFFQIGDVMPSVTFTGGVANADTYARCLKVRGVGLDVLTETAAAQLLNVSAQNIATPAVTPLSANQLVVMALWKQDDATSIATPAGFTAQGLTNMTTGDDQLAAIFTSLQTTLTPISAGSAVVTGGVTAISRAFMLALKPAPTLSVAAFDLFPPRALVTINGLATGDDVEIYRVVAGQRTLLRGGTLAGATDPAFVVVDGELPFDVPVSYLAVVNGTAEYASSAATYSLPGGKPILSDAVTGDASQFVIISWDEKEYQRQASIFKVGGRNVVVMGDLGMFEAQIEIYFEAYSSTEQLRSLLDSATEGILQLRRPAAVYDGVDCYVAVTAARERRFSADGSDGRRTWILDVVETEAWSEGLESTAFTYADVTAYYAGVGTYATLLSDHATYLAVRQASWSP